MSQNRHQAPQGFRGRTDPFDLWLSRSLHGRYDSTLEEQVPEDLMRLFSDGRGEWEAMKARWLNPDPAPPNGG